MKVTTNEDLLREACGILAYQFEKAKYDGNDKLAKELLKAFNKILSVRRGMHND